MHEKANGRNFSEIVIASNFITLIIKSTYESNI